MHELPNVYTKFKRKVTQKMFKKWSRHSTILKIKEKANIRMKEISIKK